MRLIDADKLKMSFKPYFDGKKTIGQIIDEQPTVEAQPNRCDSCTHSEEQDGSNCYECVKGMADNFEAQPSENCISILNRIMEYTYGMLTAEKIGLQHLIKSMMDELSGGGEDENSD